jgi:hypothetical protein
VLPQKILDRSDNGHFNAVYFAGLQRNLSSLEEMVCGSQVEELGLFNKTELIDCIKDAPLSYRQITGKVGLDNSLAITKQITMLPVWRPPGAGPAHIIRHQYETV